jgi:hypothetical protein
MAALLACLISYSMVPFGEYLSRKSGTRRSMELNEWIDGQQSIAHDHMISIGIDQLIVVVVVVDVRKRKEGKTEKGTERKKMAICQSQKSASAIEGAYVGSCHRNHAFTSMPVAATGSPIRALCSIRVTYKVRT